MDLLGVERACHHKGLEKQRELAVVATVQRSGAPSSSYCECTLNFTAAAQNRLDFAGKRSVDAQGRPRPF
jgi:hypothetical protein